MTARALKANLDLNWNPKFVGRERELAILNRMITNCRTEGLQAVALSAESGFGKTALVHEFRRTSTEQTYLFATRHADPRKRLFPFSSLGLIIDDLIKRILKSPQILEQEFTSKLNSKLQGDVGALFNMAPTLKNLNRLSTAAPDTASSLENLCAKIANVFETMVEVFGPVVVAIDDAHFLDTETVKALEWLTQNRTSLQLMILLSYRKSEVQPTTALNSLVGNPSRLRVIELEAMNPTEAAAFLMATLKTRQPNIVELADVLVKKSGGRPLFMTQALKTWMSEPLLFEDASGAWSWDLRAMELKETGKSVLDLLASKMRSLPKNIGYLFTMASCFPSVFSARDLSELTGVDEDRIRKATSLVLEAELLTTEGGVHFRFVNEQVRESFYSLLNLESRRSLHAHAGLKLLGEINLDTTSNDDLFLLVDHLNLGIGKIKDPSARFKIARMNLKAAQFANDVCSKQVALMFAKAGVDASEGLSWIEQGDILFQLYSIKAASEARAGDLDSALQTLAFIASNTQSKTETLIAVLQRVRLLRLSGRDPEAMNVGIEALEQAGFKVNRRIMKLTLAFKFLRAAWDFRRGRIEKLLPLAGDSDVNMFNRLRQDLIVSVVESSAHVDQLVFIDVLFNGYRLALSEGVSSRSSNLFAEVRRALANCVQILRS